MQYCVQYSIITQVQIGLSIKSSFIAWFVTKWIKQLVRCLLMILMLHVFVPWLYMFCGTPKHYPYWHFYNKFTCFLVADSLRFTSALSVGLAVVFLVIAVGISIIKIISGGIGMPRLFPIITDADSVFDLFTVVPVLVNAYICHYNGTKKFQTFI